MLISTQGRNTLPAKENTPGNPIFLFTLKCTAVSGRNVNKLRDAQGEFCLCYSKKRRYILFVKKYRNAPAVPFL